MTIINEQQRPVLVTGAVKAGVEHLVVLSQLSADEQSPVRFLRYHAAVERHIRELGIGWTFLRPNLFFQGLLAFAGTIAAQGQLFAPIGDARVSAVDVRDIAAALAAVLGRPVTFTDVAPEVFAASLHGILPPWQAGGLLEDYAHYRRGEAAAVSPAVADVTGRPAIDVRQFARDYASAFAG